LKAAAATDFEGTLHWLVAHPGRLGPEDLLGLSEAVALRLNRDVTGFLTQSVAAGSFPLLLPALESVLLDECAGQRSAVWTWLQSQPEDSPTAQLRRHVLHSAAYQDVAFAYQLVESLPPTAAGDSLVRSVAERFFDDGTMLPRFDQLLAKAPGRLRQPLVEAAFGNLRADTMVDPRVWIARLQLLPESSRGQAVESIARAWAVNGPEDAAAWAATLPANEARASAVAGITSVWAAKDSHGAAVWVAAMPPGLERDRSTRSLVLAIAEEYPSEAWDWAMSIGDPEAREQAATHAAKLMAARDADTARQWIANGPFTVETKAALQSAIP
jgi:hypothetical protein